jgi:hypothetical protein
LSRATKLAVRAGSAIAAVRAGSGAAAIVPMQTPNAVKAIETRPNRKSNLFIVDIPYTL